ncbi:MAG: hypothetical protein DMG57_09785 [Acidobacteria bacterium]|nr:MAG: hypothetical protein DMG57_09785 [Acidobacteriota bacterium]
MGKTVKINVLAYTILGVTPRDFSGTETAGWANSLPLGLDQSTTQVYAEGEPIPKPSDVPSANYYMVSPGYFGTMRTRLQRGRDFDQRDHKSSKPVAIVNRAFAAQIFPNAEAVGRRFREGAHGDWVEIVGIVEGGKYVSLSDGPRPVVFWPAVQAYNSTTTVVARSVLPAERVVRMIEQVVHEMDPGMPFFQAGSLDDHLRLPLMPARIAASMLGAFGGLAMVLAATGVYGVIAYAVARRKREIGIRVAIGAPRSHIMKLVVRRTIVLLGAGAALGAVCALGVGELFSPVLYGVSPKDPATFALGILLITLIALAACWLPARRAMSIEPSSALREE